MINDHARALMNIMDPHYTVIGVVALLPIFPDRDTKMGASPSESVTTPSHAAIYNRISHHTAILPKEKGQYAKAAGVCLFRALVERFNPYFTSKCFIPVKVIVVVIRTVNSP